METFGGESALSPYVDLGSRRTLAARSVPTPVRFRDECSCVFRVQCRCRVPADYVRVGRATRAAGYMPKSGSTGIGAGSIDVSVADPLDHPFERPRLRSMARPLPPDSRPLQWRRAPGSGRLPSRPRPVSWRGPDPRPCSDGVLRPRSVALGAWPGSRSAWLPTPIAVSWAPCRATPSSAAMRSPVAFRSWTASFRASSVNSSAQSNPRDKAGLVDDVRNAHARERHRVATRERIATLQAVESERAEGLAIRAERGSQRRHLRSAPAGTGCGTGNGEGPGR